MDNVQYEALRAAIEFETLAAQSVDPHIKATYLKLAQSYRELGTGGSQGSAPQQSQLHEQ